MSGRALVVGVTGISGGNLAQRLLADGWRVSGLCRRRTGSIARITPLAADLVDAEASPRPCAAPPRRTSSSRPGRAAPPRPRTSRSTGACSSNLLDATARREVGPPRRARHRPQALPRAVRGLRQGAAGHAVLRGAAAPAVRELLLRAGGHPLRGGGARRLHVVGAPPAHADRLGARQRHEHGRDARRLRGDLPRDGARGSASRARSEQWEAVTDVTDARLLADHLVWAATTPAAANQALNIVNGDVFRWRRLWPRLAAALGVEPEPYDGEPAPLEQQMADAGEVWPEIVRRHGLRDLPRRHARLVVAHGRRPGAHDRDVHRHGTQPAARLPRRARHASPRSPISSTACAPSGSCRERDARARAVAGGSRCARSASTPPATSASRTSPSRPRRARARSSCGSSTCGICGTDLHEYIAGPDRHARRAAPADRRAEPADPRARVRRRGRRGRRRASRASAEGDRVAIMPLAYCGRCAYCRARAAASLRDDGLRRALARWGGMAALATVDEYQVVPLPEGVTLRAGRADRAGRRRRLRRRASRRQARRPRAGHGRRPDRRAGGAVRPRRRRVGGVRLGAEPGAPRAGRGARRRDRARPDGRRRPGVPARAAATVSASTWRSSAPAIRAASTRPMRSLRKRGTLAQVGLFVGEATVDPMLWCLQRADDRRHLVLLGLRLRPHRGADRRRRPARGARRDAHGSTSTGRRTPSPSSPRARPTRSRCWSTSEEEPDEGPGLRGAATRRGRGRRRAGASPPTRCSCARATSASATRTSSSTRAATSSRSRTRSSPATSGRARSPRSAAA